MTKTDLIRAYLNQDALQTPASTTMNTELKAVTDAMSRDEAAEQFQENQHHAMVVDKDCQFVGLISSLDIVMEVAEDSKSWPWFRTRSKLNKVAPAVAN